MITKKHSIYTQEFRAEAVKLAAENNGNISQVAANLGLAKQTLHNWVIKANQGKLQGAAGYSSELVNLQDEVKQLKKDLKRTEMERDILKKATAYFAKLSQ